ncbi:MAG: TonB-dependent receptor, partial [Bacteroidota bacterium]
MRIIKLHGVGRLLGLMVSCLIYGQVALGQSSILDQKINLSVKDASVTEVMRLLRKETGYFFNYANSDLPTERRITKVYKNESLRKLLRDVWGSEAINLKVVGKTIDIRSENRKPRGKPGNIEGQVLDATGKPLAYATVGLKGTNLGVLTDTAGYFSWPTVAAGTQSLVISSMGYAPQEVEVNIPDGQTIHVEISLTEAANELDEVIVEGKTLNQLKMEEPIKVEVIDIKKLQTKSLSLPQVINQSPGVKIRQAGGVGSATIININGLQGNAIRFFRDGIPLDYLGRAFALNLVPVDQLDNIEIYKGVLPAELGVDALGGALNLTSRKDFSNNLDLAYTIGSFNTHQINVNGYLDIPNSKLFVSLASYYLYSDNNYKVTVPIADEETANLVDTEVERFHDGIETYFAETKVGLRDFKYGDLLVFGYSHFDLEKERQNGLQLDPNSALGEVMDFETSNVLSLRYKLNKGKFSTDVFGAYSNQNTLFVDDPESRWNWLGERIPLRNQGGESSPFSRYYRDLNFKTWTARINAGYKLSENHQLVFNHNLISKDRIGSDTLEIIFGTDIDPLTFPTNYTRHISGLGLTSSLWKNKIQNVLTVKQFHLNTSTTQAGLVADDDPIVVNKTSHGIGNSTKFSLNKN